MSNSNRTPRGKNKDETNKKNERLAPYLRVFPAASELKAPMGGRSTRRRASDASRVLRLEPETIAARSAHTKERRSRISSKRARSEPTSGSISLQGTTPTLDAHPSTSKDLRPIPPLPSYPIQSPLAILGQQQPMHAMASQQQHQRTREMEMGFDSAQTIQYGYQDDHRSPSLTTGFLNRQQYQDLDEHAFVPTNHDFSSGGVHRPLYQEQDIAACPPSEYLDIDVDALLTTMMMYTNQDELDDRSQYPDLA